MKRLKAYEQYVKNHVIGRPARILLISHGRAKTRAKVVFVFLLFSGFDTQDALLVCLLTISCDERNSKLSKTHLPNEYSVCWQDLTSCVNVLRHLPTVQANRSQHIPFAELCLIVNTTSGLLCCLRSTTYAVAIIHFTATFSNFDHYLVQTLQFSR